MSPHAEFGDWLINVVVVVEVCLWSARLLAKKNDMSYVVLMFFLGEICLAECSGNGFAPFYDDLK